MVTSSRSRVVAVIAAAAVATAGGAVISGHSDPNPTPAQGGGGVAGQFNVFVAASGCTSTPTRLSSPVDFASAPGGSKACTMAQACTAASVSDRIGWLNGTYAADQTCSKAVTISGQDVTQVIETGSVTPANNSTIENVTGINDAHHYNPLSVGHTDGVTVRNFRAEGDYVEVTLRALDNFTWDGGRLGDFDGTINTRLCNDGGGVNHRDGEPLWIGVEDVVHTPVSHNVTVKGVEFSDQQPLGVDASCGSGDDFHLEIIRIDGPSVGVNILRNYFHPSGANSAVIFTTSFEGGSPVNVNVIGNFIGDSPTTSIDAENVSCANWKVGYNTTPTHLGTFTCSSYSGAKWVGNVTGTPGSETPSCGDITWTDNLTQSVSDKNCNTGDDSGNLWVSGPNFQIGNLGVAADGHLNAGSPAIDIGETVGAGNWCGDASLGMDKDIDGDPRPNGTRCDAGADER